jgi:hypothetical protein
VLTLGALQHTAWTSFSQSLYSVRIDVDQLLLDREHERLERLQATQNTVTTGNQKPKVRKRKHGESTTEPGGKKLKVTKDKGSHVAATSKTSFPKLSITLKIGPPREIFPCCLCVSEDTSGLLPVYDPMLATSTPKMAHEHCASVIPETWVDEYEVNHPSSSEHPHKTRVVFGIDGIVKDRWNLVGYMTHSFPFIMLM